MSAILPFIDDASNWYVRRSRKRFWKSGKDEDKQTAYRTLHYVLIHLSIILAPFTPFMSEEMFLKLTDGKLGESVHLLDWPESGHVNELLIDEMHHVRTMINLGLKARAEQGIKVRQPLSGPAVSSKKAISSPELKQILEEELNVKPATYVVDPSKPYGVTMNFKITPDLKQEGQMRELVRLVQNARKQAGLKVDDRINLAIETKDSDLSKVVAKYTSEIQKETLAKKLLEKGDYAFSVEIKVDDKPATIKLEKTTS